MYRSSGDPIQTFVYLSIYQLDCSLFLLPFFFPFQASFQSSSSLTWLYRCWKYSRGSGWCSSICMERGKIMYSWIWKRLGWLIEGEGILSILSMLFTKYVSILFCAILWYLLHIYLFFLFYLFYLSYLSHQLYLFYLLYLFS